MLTSLRHPNYAYISETLCIRTRLQTHNSGNGVRDTVPSNLHPVALFAHICGFANTRSDLRDYIGNKWQESRDVLIAQGDKNSKSWAYCGNHMITKVNEHANQFGVIPSELKLVRLFDEKVI